MAVSVKNIKFKVAQLLRAERFILVCQTEKYVFKDGKPTGDKYHVATVTTAESCFEKIDDKLEGKGIDISNEALQTRNCNFDFVWVTFEGDEVKIYTDFKSGEQKVSAKAESIHLWVDEDVVI